MVFLCALCYNDFHICESGSCDGSFQIFLIPLNWYSTDSPTAGVRHALVMLTDAQTFGASFAKGERLTDGLDLDLLQVSQPFSIVRVVPYHPSGVLATVAGQLIQEDSCSATLLQDFNIFGMLDFCVLLEHSFLLELLKSFRC